MLLKVTSLLLLLNYCNAANILGIFHHPGKSHHMLGEVLLKAMASRGHKVTMVSPFPLKEPFPNYRDIVTPETMQDMNNRIKNEWFQKFSHNSASIDTFFMLLNMTVTQADLLFQNAEFKKMWTSNEKVDLILIDWMFNESHLIFSKIFKCPIILMATAGTAFNVNYIVGNTAPYSYVPFKYFPITDKMNFWERTMNTIVHVSAEVVSYYQRIKQQKILHRYIPDAPSIDELSKNVALVLSNGHYSYETRRPSVPNSIDIGGFHVGEVKQLPKDIKAYLDSAKDGFIYFSLGSNMKSIFLDEKKLNGILSAFSKVNLKVLWKLEKDIPNKPKNIKIAKWLPQNDVLAHPNIKLFITHGGLLSTIESIHHGVPMIGIPMFGDQNSNVPTGVEAGYTLRIKPEEICEEALLANIQEMLRNETYSKKAKLHSDLLRNQPIKPLDKGVFWMEHVIKHKGAKHLANASMNLHWYQNLLIDVFIFLFAILLSVIGLCYLMIRLVLKMFIKNKRISQLKKKKNN
ncbi:PREDICTED: UDP-glucuronosyltransferase 2B15-like [Nicrophorus vespilloides]|uniref:UDP-glucuronosyltransferase n=1 Tax=Nicrophorus vespilloides TaxID=110193 RepID=A0ABM1N475_NICVS|nr:PREDICTED: UDP-glucuronosyltransferase 2B15-like [Nicrophorus vespilloides]